MQIKVDYSRTFSFARMQNGIPAVRSICLNNQTQEQLDGVRVRIDFDPHIADSFETGVDSLRPRSKALLDSINIIPSASFLANLTEKAEGRMGVSVTTGDAGLLKQDFPVSLLPYDFWEGMRDAPELLACYVVPNHPSLRPILKAAAEKLGKWTGKASLSGYQEGDPNWVKLQMAAVYEAIHDLGIIYSNPPASFAEDGQRVRLPEEILSSGMATCLDSSLLYAGCLEAIGINPIVVVTEGHAFAGAWLVRKSSPYPVNDDPASLRKGSADGINEVLLVETTLADKAQSSPFDAAVASASRSILDIDSFICYFDIASCRNIGILPIPMRVLTPEGYIIDESTVKSHGKPSRVPSTDVIDVDREAKVDKHTIWERKLLDLTMRNDLLNVHTKRGVLQLVSPLGDEVVRMLEDDASFHIFGLPQGWNGVSGNDGIFLEVPDGDPMASFASNEARDFRLHTFLDEDESSQRLDSIRNAARHSLEENGANTLFLTVGALRWSDDESGRSHYAPILLIPVEITKTTWALCASGEEITANLTLLEKLRQEYGISIPGLDTLPEKDGHVDVRLVLNTVRRAVMEKKGWDVQELMFLGNFTFNKFIIWNDIHTHREMLDSNQAVSSLIAGKLKVNDIMPPEGDVDTLCTSAGILQPISADSSQLMAIYDAVAGRSFVMHGPPGTGKSQTITNIIANLLYKGKKVLFVSEKKAALEVVQKRLDDIGLSPFCLELHSNKARKTTVLTKLDSTLAVDKPARSPFFKDEADRMDAMRKALDLHAVSLNKVYPSGMSLYDCLSRYLALQCSTATKRLPNSLLAKLNPTEIRAMESEVKDFMTAVSHTGIGPSCGLLDFPIADYTPDLKEKYEARIDAILGRKGLPFWWQSRRLEGELGTGIGVRLSSGAMAELRKKLSRWRESSDQMRQYAIYSRQRAVLIGHGLSVITKEYEAGKVAADEILDYFHKCLYRSYAEYILGYEKSLNIFCGDIFESTVRKFREADEAFNESTRKELFAAAASRLPDPLKDTCIAGEMAILKKAIRNTARGMSLRTLFGKIPNLLPKLCPCMLMSPLSVSQYLQPGSGQFDLVIFDEASQLPTSEAVAAIARGKSLVVVGDPKQLPPTSFFESSSFDEDNVEKEDLESILDECLALSFPSVHLRWHYRSRHESLIAFSNAHYYDNRLLTFPSCDDMTTRVSFRHIDGVYDRGHSRTNEAEADAVVKEICARAADPGTSGMSIGVVTFNVSQKGLIEKKLEAALAKNKAVAKQLASMDEPLFIKSLESVQGDERDVILFSIGYGADKNGRVSMNFGPVNQDGGWRRLNVAVSRARQEMTVFSSLQPEQIGGAGYVPRGVADLKAFLKYARDGRESLETDISASSAADAYAELLADELRAEGYEVNTGIGSSDFRVDVGVVDPSCPGRYLYGILCDGPAYASAESARDREIIRPQVLEGLGWTIKRSWILDRYDN